MVNWLIISKKNRLLEIRVKWPARRTASVCLATRISLTAAAHLWMFNGSNCPIDSSRWLPPPLLHTAAICSAAAVDVIVLALMIIVVPSNWFLTDDLSTISTNTLSHFHFLSVIMIIAPSKIATHCGAAAVAAAGSQLFFCVLSVSLCWCEEQVRQQHTNEKQSISLQ